MDTGIVASLRFIGGTCPLSCYYSRIDQNAYICICSLTPTHTSASFCQKVVAKYADRTCRPGVHMITSGHVYGVSHFL